MNSVTISSPMCQRLLVVASPILAVAYVTDRAGSLIEPVFFVVFSATLLMELFEPRGAESSTPAPSAAVGGAEG